MSRQVQTLIYIFTVFVYFSASAHKCEDVLLTKVDGMRLHVRFTPVNNSSLIINGGTPSEPYVVSRTGVDRIELIDNRVANLGVYARAQAMYTAPEGYTIQGARGTESGLILHLQASVWRPFQRRHFLIEIEISGDSFKIHRRNPWPLRREWHIEKFVKHKVPDGHFQDIEAVREKLDSGSYIQRDGNFIFGEISRYLGETTRDGFRYYYFARDHMLRLEGPLSFDSLKRSFDSAKSHVTVVKKSLDGSQPDQYLGTDISGLIQISYLYISPESPLVFYVQRMVNGSSHQDFRNPTGNQSLIQIDLQNLPWEKL
jgi:hypothetical protein